MRPEWNHRLVLPIESRCGALRGAAATVARRAPIRPAAAPDRGSRFAPDRSLQAFATDAVRNFGSRQPTADDLVRHLPRGSARRAGGRSRDAETDQSNQWTPWWPLTPLSAVHLEVDPLETHPRRNHPPRAARPLRIGAESGEGEALEDEILRRPERAAVARLRAHRDDTRRSSGLRHLLMMS